MKVYSMPEVRNFTPTVYIPEFDLYAEMFRGVVERYKSRSDGRVVGYSIQPSVMENVLKHESDGTLPEWVLQVLKPKEAAKLRKLGYVYK